MLALQLLGPVTLRRDGRPLTLGVKKTVALVGLVACSGAVPRARVVALLWPRLDEATGRRNLRRELARLREAGAADVLQSDGDRLVLSAQVTCDLHEFEAALEQARHEHALTLWRGRPADGLVVDDAADFNDWLDSERTRLFKLRHRALQASAEAHEARGAIEPALQRIEQLLADDPLQEQHHRDAMRLHAAAGRREAALAQYRRCVELLHTELGLAPMAETEALAAALRGARPTPARTAARKPEQLLPEQLPFVGREAQVATLERAWRAGAAVLIEGEGGVGKSRLAVGVASAAGPIALVRCRPGDAELPYAAFTRALQVLAGPRPERGSLAAAGVAGWAIDELARLLPELGAPPPPLRSAEDRARFFDACVHGWLSLAAGDFDVVLLDDWHQADPASLSLLIHVSQQRRDRGLAGPREWVLVRPEIDRDALQRLHEGLRPQHLTLPPLDAPEVLELVRQLSGAARPTRFAARLLQATGGNPFFLAETLRHLAELHLLAAGDDGAWQTPFDDATQDYRELPVPASVRDAVLARVQRLGDATRRVLEAAALSAEPFEPALLAPACALSELQAVLAIEQAVQAQLLREHDAGGYAFAHDLVQQALDAALGAERRRLVHRRLALGAESLGLAPALVAHHHEASGAAQRALPFRLAAGDEALRLFDHALALQQWRAALSAAPAAALRAQLLPRCARAQIELGDAAGAGASMAALDALIADGSLEPAARSAARVASAELRCDLDQNADALPRIEALLAEGPTGPLRVQALRVRSHALQNLGRLDEARDCAQQALAAVGDDAMARAGLLDMLLMIEYTAGRPQQALALARQSVAVWTAQGDRRHIARGHFRIGTLLLISGQTDAGAVELERARTLAADGHLLELQREVIVNLMKVHADRGDGARMLALAEEAWHLSPGFARPRTRQLLLQARLHAHTLLGDLGQALSIAEQVLAEAEANGEPGALQYAVVTVLDLLVYLGDFARGRALLDRLAAADTQQLAYLGIKLSFMRAFLEIRCGELGRARDALAQVGDPEQLQQPQDRLDLALRDAELLLAAGDAAAAWQRVEQAEDGGAEHVQLQAALHAIRLQAALALGRSTPAEWQQAHALWQANTVPPLDALGLLQALARCAPTAADAAAPAAAREALVGRLADSLAHWPVHRQRFLAQAGS